MKTILFLVFVVVGCGSGTGPTNGQEQPASVYENSEMCSLAIDGGALTVSCCDPSGIQIIAPLSVTASNSPLIWMAQCGPWTPASDSTTCTEMPHCLDAAPASICDGGLCDEPCSAIAHDGCVAGSLVFYTVR